MRKIFKFVIISFLFIILSCSSFTGISCRLCHYVLGSIQKRVPSQITIKKLQKIAIQFCRINLQQQDVCKGAIKQMTKFIIKQTWYKQTNPHSLCQKMKMCKKQYIVRNLFDDIQKIIKDKPQHKWQQPSFRKQLKILHISDLHLDFKYKQGSPTKCNQPLCCRGDVIATQNSTQAGYWGSFSSCDLPLHTFDLFLEQIKKQKIDAIIWTGDNNPHDIWKQSLQQNLNYTNVVVEKLSKLQIPILLTFGNHQTHPVNIYNFQKGQQKQFNQAIAKIWQKIIGQQASNMVKQNGCYSKVYPQLNNIKVLSINTQAANNQNWILLSDPTDPGKLLQWIQSELRQSQKIGQLVYLIGHIPPKQALNQWGMRLNALIDRFSYNIRGNFFGHNHKDHIGFIPQFNSLIYTNISYSKISSYYMLAPTLSTFTYRIPQYRIMNVDYDTMIVTNYKQYLLDIRKYKYKHQIPQFEQFYQFNKQYSIDSMTIQNMQILRNKIRDNKYYQKIFIKHKCFQTCQIKGGKQVFCDTTTSRQFYSQCMQKKYSPSIFQLVSGQWKQWIYEI